MTSSSSSGNKSQPTGRYSSVSNDEYAHSINSAAGLTLQAFVDDIPFQFNPKYRTIVVSNIDIPEYDTSKIRDLLAQPVDFSLEKRVLLEALEDVQRKKKEIEADTLRQQMPSPPTTNIQTNNPVPPPPPPSHVPSVPFPAAHIPPPLPHVRPPVTPVPPPLASKPLVSPSYHLPSVRDIYYPDVSRQQHCIVPTPGPPTMPANTLSLPTPIHSTNSSPNSVNSNNRSFNNCDSTAATNELAATFDGALGSDDPFHDAELKSLNDAAELRHLYTAIASANTVRR